MTAKSSGDIEAALERDRAALKDTLGALGGRLSLDGLAQEALGLARANAGVYRQSLDTAIRANPLALALTGAGLAWLMFGGRRSTGTVPKPSSPMTRVETLSRWEDDGGPVAPLPLDDLEEEWARRTDTLRARATQRLARIEEDARSAAQTAVEGLAGRIEKVRDFAAERAAVIAEFTEHLGKSFRYGLSGMNEAAQDRIASAREVAYAARLKAEKMAGRGTRETGRLIEDHPMVAAAIALALGAALGAIIPRTRTENGIVGPEHDRLVRDAAQALHREKARAARLAGEIGADLKAAATDVMQSVTDKAVELSERATARIKDEAASMADTREPAPRSRKANS